MEEKGSVLQGAGNVNNKFREGDDKKIIECKYCGKDVDAMGTTRQFCRDTDCSRKYQNEQKRVKRRGQRKNMGKSRHDGKPPAPATDTDTPTGGLTAAQQLMREIEVFLHYSTTD